MLKREWYGLSQNKNPNRRDPMKREWYGLSQKQNPNRRDPMGGLSIVWGDGGRAGPEVKLSY